ncbi:hypothetical protein Q7P36_010327 [Cladosporium allicinum]
MLRGSQFVAYKTSDDVSGVFCGELGLSFVETTGLGLALNSSTQSTAYQQKLRERVQLPYQLLSDESLELVVAAKLPTIQWRGSTLTKRLTMAVEDGKIVKVWYPVFPPDKNASEVLEWLKVRK